MAAAIALGGFTGPEADTLGYAIRKKKSSVLRAQKEKFVTQAAERGVEPHVIDAVFKAFEPFERYGFNKAHATCYGLIAYQTAYLKANYTVEYMTARPDGLPRRTRRRWRPRSPSAAGWGSRSICRTSTAPASSSPSRARRSGSGCWPSRTSARARSNRSSRRGTAGGAFKSLGRLLLADRPAAREPQGPRGARQGRGARRFGHPAQILLGSTTRSTPAQAAQRDRITGQTLAVRPRRRRTRPPWSGRCRPATEVPAASGSAGRRSSSGCTSRSTRWARSPSRSARS